MSGFSTTVPCWNQSQDSSFAFSPFRVVGIFSEAGSASTASDLYQRAGLGRYDCEDPRCEPARFARFKGSAGTLPVREELKNQPPWNSQLVEARAEKEPTDFLHSRWHPRSAIKLSSCGKFFVR